MGIAEFLDAPDGAVLVAINGEVELVTTHHETSTKLTIERFPLGPVVAPAAVMALLGSQGMLPATVVPTPALPHPEGTRRPARAPRQSPVLAPPPEDRPAVCGVCGKGFKRASQLIRHERVMHGADAAKDDLPCPVCGHPCRGSSGLRIHAGKQHRGVAAAMIVPAVSHMERAPGPPTVAAMPQDPRGLCDVCGMPQRQHLQCEECGRRIGPGHTVDAPAKQVRGKVWCETCVALLRKAAA